MRRVDCLAGRGHQGALWGEGHPLGLDLGGSHGVFTLLIIYQAEHSRLVHLNINHISIKKKKLCACVTLVTKLIINK